MLADVSDEEKQKLLIDGLGKVLINLFLVLMIVVVAVMSLLLILYGYSVWQSRPFEQLDLDSGTFYLALAIGSILPFVPLMLKKSQSGYSESARLLHQIILDNQNLGKSLFQFESRFYLRDEKAVEPKAVIVTGLARAGTTALTTQLHEIGDFYSLSYANMPFLMAPNLWQKIYKPKNVQKTERSHGDGVEFGLDSVEALEEYFWKSQLSDAFIEPDHLKQHTVTDDTARAYKNYQKIVRLANDSGSIYLAKNNNMMLRYDSIKAHVKNLNIILLIRSPLEHANSLLKQHLRFSEMQSEDAFILEYMNWLGHHEFGLNQKEFKFGDQKISNLDKTTIDYWLTVWINYYSAVKNHLSDEQINPLCYEDFLANPTNVFEKLSEQMGLSLRTKEFKKFIPRTSKTPAPNDQKLLAKAEDLYEEIKAIRL
jgi:hypothetical protein